MIVTYFRSSSLGAYSFCAMKYFLVFVLGWKEDANQSAEKGTIVHKVMEGLAQFKKNSQEHDKKTIVIEDDVYGKMKCSRDELFEMTELTNEEIDKFHAGCINKAIYKTPLILPYGHSRMGVNLVKKMFDISYEHYSSRSKNTWKDLDRRDSYNWLWMGLDYDGGTFDPRNRTIIDTEPHFDIEIDRPWAEYEYELAGSKLKGKLAIKGTVDLITKVDDGIYEIIDWKTGQRLKWDSKENPIPVKTYEDFCKDVQLMMYYYAVKQMYPDVKEIIVTIFYVRDGGPFTVCFDEETIKKIELVLQQKFNLVKNDESPAMLDPAQKCFKCQRLCHFYKNSFPNSDKNMCLQTNDMIKTYGLQHTMELLMNPDFDIHSYSAPGESE